MYSWKSSTQHFRWSDSLFCGYSPFTRSCSITSKLSHLLSHHRLSITELNIVFPIASRRLFLETLSADDVRFVAAKRRLIPVTENNKHHHALTVNTHEHAMHLSGTCMMYFIYTLVTWFSKRSFSFETMLSQSSESAHVRRSTWQSSIDITVLPNTCTSEGQWPPSAAVNSTMNCSTDEMCKSSTLCQFCDFLILSCATAIGIPSK